jgi:hypothetical protein
MPTMGSGKVGVWARAAVTGHSATASAIAARHPARIDTARSSHVAWVK